MTTKNNENSEPANNITCPNCGSESCFVNVNDEITEMRCDGCGFHDTVSNTWMIKAIVSFVHCTDRKLVPLQLRKQYNGARHYCQLDNGKACNENNCPLKVEE